MGPTDLFGIFFSVQQIFERKRKDLFLQTKMWKLCCILVVVSLTLLESNRVEAKPLEIQEMGDVLGQGNSFSQTAGYNIRIRRQSYDSSGSSGSSSNSPSTGSSGNSNGYSTSGPRNSNDKD